MLRLTVAPYDDTDANGLKDKPALDAHYDRLIDEPAAVYLEGHDLPHIVYGPLPDEWAGFAPTLLKVRYPQQVRTSGMLTRARTFGYMPRQPIRKKDHCLPCSMNYQYPEAWRDLERFSHAADALYREWRPDVYAAQRALVDGIEQTWRIPDTAFTGGIVNLTTALPYHRDRGNFAGSWNVMAVWRHRMEGGHVVVPSLRMAFAAAHNTFMVFPAQDTLHGVSPLHKTGRDGWRISAVCFATRALANCGTPDEEKRRARKLRTEREFRRAGRTAPR